MRPWSEYHTWCLNNPCPWHDFSWGNLSVSERGMWRRMHFSRATGCIARVSSNGAILGIYKQIWESYITVIVPSPRSCWRRSSYKRVVYGEWQKRTKKERRRREGKKRRGRRILASMSPFELIGIWINSPARPSEGRNCVKRARNGGLRNQSWARKKKRIIRTSWRETFIFIEKSHFLT